MKFALVISNDPIVYLPYIGKVFEGQDQSLRTIILVPGIRNMKLKNQYFEVIRRTFSFGYFIQCLWQYLRGPAWSFQTFGKKFGVQILYASGPNAEEFARILAEEKIEALISLTPEIYGKKILTTPGLAVYNLHGSILPGNKGILPLFWTSLKNEIPGITVHRMAETIDSGETIYQASAPHLRGASLPRLCDYLLENCGTFIRDSIAIIEGRKSPVLVQGAGPPEIRKLPSHAEIQAYHEEMKRRGKT